MKVAKETGGKEELDEGKLWNSMYYPARESHYSDEEAVELADEAKERVLEWLKEHEDDVVTSEEIRTAVIEVLEEFDTGVALMYETHLDLG
ncbi:MAG: ATP cone domain-containing protein [Candidatus Nanohaloarchaea archaeon]